MPVGPFVSWLMARNGRGAELGIYTVRCYSNGKCKIKHRVWKEENENGNNMTVIMWNNPSMLKEFLLKSDAWLHVCVQTKQESSNMWIWSKCRQTTAQCSLNRCYYRWRSLPKMIKVCPQFQNVEAQKHLVRLFYFYNSKSRTKDTMWNNLRIGQFGTGFGPFGSSSCLIRCFYAFASLLTSHVSSVFPFFSLSLSREPLFHKIPHSPTLVRCGTRI